MKKILLILAMAVSFSFSCLSGNVAHYALKVVARYPHSTESYTQGLFFYGGELYESAGQYRKSAFRKLELSSGDALNTLTFADKYFLEGSVALNGKLYLLTWTNSEAFVYDLAALSFEKSYSYPREGWGLTTDGKQLVASDGSNRIYFMDTAFRVQRTVDVTLGGRPVMYLNELEWVDGKLWANVYTTDRIIIINPADGAVEAIIDCAGLLPEYERTRDTDVLNGIAVNPADGKIYLTGKNWPYLYQVELVPSTR